MNTSIRKLGCWLMAAGLAYSTVPLAQDKSAGYPQRPIRIIIATAFGGGPDYIARITAQMLTDRWGQNVVVDARPGGGGVIGVEAAARATPDGYTILQFGDGMMLMGAQKRVPFDVLKAFDPVVALSTQPYVLVVHPNVPASSIKELIALSQTKPLTYGTTFAGTIHVGMERFASLSGMKLKHIAYKGGGPALLALMGGEINLVTGTPMLTGAAIRTGKVRGVAILGAKRIAALPELPTLAEEGITGFTLTNRFNLWAPAGTPRAIIAALNHVVSDGFNTPQMVQRLAADGSGPAERMTPAELKAALAREFAEVVQMVAQLDRKTP